MAISFNLSDEQVAKIDEWIRNRPGVAIGGRFVYMFCNTTIGQAQRVRDDITGEELDVTNYNEW